MTNTKRSTGLHRTLLLFVMSVLVVSSGVSQAFASTSSPSLPPIAAALQNPSPNALSHVSPLAGGPICDLTIDKTVSPPNPVASGSTVTITFTVTDVGAAACGSPGILNNQTSITDNMPNGLSAVSSSAPPGWNCAIPPDGSSVSCSTSSAFAPNQPATVTAQATVTAASGTVTNCASVSSGMDQNASDNQSCAPIAVSGGSPCDLQITKTISPSSVVSGSPATVTLVIENVGQATCGVGVTYPTTVTDSLPAGMTAGSPAAPSGWNCQVSGSTVTCASTTPQSSTIPPQAQVTITIPVTVTSSAAFLSNCASVSNPYDQDPANDQSCAQVKISPAPQPQCSLAVTKTAQPSSANVGDTVTFTVAVTNTGGPTCGGAAYPPVTTVDDIVPSGFTNPVGAGAGWTCTTSGQDVSCTTPGLNPPQSSTITITATVDPTAAAGTYQNCADLSNIGSVPQASQSCAQVVISSPSPAPYCDMEVTTALMPASGPSDSVVTLTATVTNVGTKTCARPYGYPVTDLFPAGMLGYPPVPPPPSYPIVPLSNPLNWNCNRGYDSFGCGNYVSPMTPGETNTISLQVTAWGTAGSIVTNCVDLPIMSQPPVWTDDVNPSNNHACATFTLTTSSGLCDRAVAETIQPASGPSGQTATFTVTGTNIGAHACPPGSTVWTPQIGTGMTPVAGSLVSSSPGWMCHLDTIPNLPNPPTINAWCEEKTPQGAGFTYPLMQPGETVTYSFQAVMSGAAGTIYSKCAGTSFFGDSDLSNNNSCATYVIQFPGCDRAVTKTMLPATGPSGQTVTVTLTVSNVGTGSCPAESGWVTLAHIHLLGDNLPAGMTTVAGSVSAPSGWSCGVDPNDFYCTKIPTMQPGDSASFSFQATVAGNTGATITNCASLTTLDDGNLNNNNACTNFTVGSSCPQNIACRVMQTPSGLSLSVTRVALLQSGQPGSYEVWVNGVLTNGGNRTEYALLGSASGSPAIVWQPPNITLSVQQLVSTSNSSGAGDLPALQADIMIEVVAKSTAGPISNALNVTLPLITLNPGESTPISIMIPVTVNSAGIPQGTELHIPLSFGISLSEDQSSSAYRALQCFLSGSPGSLVALCSGVNVGTSSSNVGAVPEFSASWLALLAGVIMPLMVLRTRKRFDKSAKS